MRYKLFIVATLSFLQIGVALLAQEGFVTAGQTATGSGGTQSYTIGQVFYLAPSSAEGSVIQGLQQPYEISLVNALAHTEAITLALYPNPVTDRLTLQIGDIPFINLSFQLCDINGRVLRTGQNLGSQTVIDMSGFVTGIYLLMVNQDDLTVKSYKIIKK